MDLRTLLFAAGTCFCMGATAQVTNGFALSIDTKLEPKLHKVEVNGLITHRSLPPATEQP